MSDWINDLKNVTSGNISDTSRENANKALAASSQQSMSQSIREIQQLARDGERLDTRLLESQRLIEKAKLPSRLQAKDLRDAYVVLLWDSREIASTGKGSADDFRGDMIDLVLMSDVTNAEKIQELNNWNALTLVKGNQAAKQPKAFSDYSNKLKAYIPIVQKEVQVKETEAKKKLEQYTAKIAELNKTLSTLDVSVIGPITEFLKIGAGAFSGVISGAPETALEALLQAIASGVPELMKFDEQLKQVQKQRNEIYQQLFDLKAQIRAVESEQATLGDASTVPYTLTSVVNDLVDFSSRMTTALNVFTQLSNEQQAIQVFLKKNVSVSDPLFVSQVNLAKNVTGLTSKILEIYSKGNPDV